MLYQVSLRRKNSDVLQGPPRARPVCRRRRGEGALSRLAPGPPAQLVAGLPPASPWPAVRLDAPIAPRSPARATGAKSAPRPLTPAYGHHSAPGDTHGRHGHDDAREGLRRACARAGQRPCKTSRSLRLTSRSLRHKRHVRCAILLPLPPRAPASLLLSVIPPPPRPHKASDDRHILCGSAHRT